MARQQSSKSGILKSLGPTDISPQDVLNLLLLEATLDDQPSRSVYTAGRPQLSEQELCHMLVRSLHTLAYLSDVGEDGLLVPFAKTLRRRDFVAPRSTRQQVGVVVVQQGEKSRKEERVADWLRSVVRPDAGALL